jgi:hypothetical protein
MIQDFVAWIIHILIPVKLSKVRLPPDRNGMLQYIYLVKIK